MAAGFKDVFRWSWGWLSVAGDQTLTVPVANVTVEANTPGVLGGATASVEVTYVCLEPTITMTSVSLNPSLED